MHPTKRIISHTQEKMLIITIEILNTNKRNNELK